MSQTDWAKIYAAMDKRIVVKYEQLPEGGASRQASASGAPTNKKFLSRIDMFLRGCRKRLSIRIRSFLPT